MLLRRSVLCAVNSFIDHFKRSSAEETSGEEGEEEDGDVGDDASA